MRSPKGVGKIFLEPEGPNQRGPIPKDTIHLYRKVLVVGLAVLAGLNNKYL